MNKILYIIFITLLFSSFSQAKVKDKDKLTLIYVKPNALLLELSSGLTVKAPKGFYANSFEKNPLLRDQFYLYTKAGKAKYIVESKDIEEIEDMINLLPEEKGDKFYPPQSQYRAANSIFPFESELEFHLDEIDLSPLGEFLQSDVNTITSSRFKVDTHFVSLMPVNVGFNLNFQATSWKDQNQINSQLSILSMGPEFKLRLLNTDTYQLGFIFSYEFCPIYEVSSEQGKDKFSAYLWDIGLQNEFTTSIGKVSVGADFRKHFLTFKSSSRSSLILSPFEYAISSIGLSVGYKLDWEL